MKKITRRSLLGGAALAGASAAISSPAEAFFFSRLKFYWKLKYKRLLPELFASTPTPPRHSEAIVIGSGFGGAISAHRLAEAGIQTTVLERGQRWPSDPWRDIHAYEPFPDGRGFWQQKSVGLPIVTPMGLPKGIDKFGGVLDITKYNNMEVWRGACVGGGSMVFTGVMIEPPRQYFEAIFGDTVSYDDMVNFYYPRVREMLDLSTMPEDVYNSKPFAHSRVWDDQARAAGYSPERIDSIFNWDVVRDELNGHSRKSATIGMSNLGNSNGAKFDLNQNYLKYAERSGYAKIYPNQQVTDIKQEGSGYRVYIEKLDPFGSVKSRYSITCNYLFLSAGSVGTSELLVKAKAKRTISGLNDEIGRGWGSNGDSIVVRSFNKVDGLKTQGSPSASKIHDADGPAPVTLENWYVPGVPIDVGILGSLGMTMDLENRGSFTYESRSGKVKLNWARNGNDVATAAARRVNDKIADATKPSVAGLPPIVPDVWTGFTAHPLGGAVLGKATDNYGRVKGTRGLYVMDGAAIPGSTGTVNPSLTISALAERNIARIIADDF